MKSLILCSVGAAIVVLLLAQFGVTQRLGAHPWWAFDVALYGVVPGVLLALLLFWATQFAAYFAAFDLILSGIVAWQGKRMFAATSGDSVLGGQMWFFGWIAVCACATALIALIVHRVAYPAARSRAD